MANLTTKICPVCRRSFSVHASIVNNRRCCSGKCRSEWIKSNRAQLTCVTCGIQFTVPPSEEKKGRKFCSRDCTRPMYSKLFSNNKYRQGQIPWNKGTKGVMPEGWSKGGANLAIRGEKNPNWKGGVGTERAQAMGKIEYKQWRTAVFKRDNYTCQMCSQYGGTLHADHIEKWSENEELRYNIDNGRTLCVPCHYYITFKRKMMPGQRWCNFTAETEG